MLARHTAEGKPPRRSKRVAGRERRSALRIRTVFRLARVSSDEDVGLWRVRNLSDTGMMFCTGTEPACGKALSIGLSESIVLSAKVAWTDEQHCGVEFDERISCEAILNQLSLEQHTPQYREQRLPIRRCAVAYSDCGIRSVQVANLSQHGMGLIHDGRFRAGLQVKLLMQSGVERRGVIRWADDSHAGLLLTEPFSFTALESMSRI